jgi:indolepyruvate ferredoxin oxidoreductase beta subunit
MVMVGAASPFLPVKAETLEQTIAAMFAAKETSVLEANTKAFQLGREASGRPGPARGGSAQGAAGTAK